VLEDLVLSVVCSSLEDFLKVSGGSFGFTVGVYKPLVRRWLAPLFVAYPLPDVFVQRVARPMPSDEGLRCAHGCGRTD